MNSEDYIHRDGPIFNPELDLVKSQLVFSAGSLLKRIQTELSTETNSWRESQTLKRFGIDERATSFGWWGIEEPWYPSEPYRLGTVDISDYVGKWVLEAGVYKIKPVLIEFERGETLFDVMYVPSVSEMDDLTWDLMSEEEQERRAEEEIDRYRLPKSFMCLETSIIGEGELHFDVNLPLVSYVDGLNGELLDDSFEVWMDYNNHIGKRADPHSQDNLILRQFSKTDLIRFTTWIVNGFNHARAITKLPDIPGSESFQDWEV